MRRFARRDNFVACSRARPLRSRKGCFDCAGRIASLSMTISSSLSCLAEDGRGGTRGPFVVEASLLSASAHFQGDQIAGFRAAGFVVDRDLKVSPVTGKVVGADE